MVTEVDDTFVLLMHDTLRTFVNAVEMNGPAQYMLAQELGGLEKPMESITLGELQVALERVDVRYHHRAARLDHRPTRIYRRVMAKGVCVGGRWYTAPQLADMVGKEIAIEIQPESSLTLLVSHELGSLQLHAAESGRGLTPEQERLAYKINKYISDLNQRLGGSRIELVATPEAELMADFRRIQRRYQGTRRAE
jgi:hypothetical protein